MIKRLVEEFVRNEYPENRFIKYVLLQKPIYWDNNANDEGILKAILKVLQYGTGLDDENLKELFDQFRSDIIIYFEGFIDRTGYDNFFVADAEVPLYKFIMSVVLDDLAYCLGWYIIEQLENDYPELQDADCLECALEILLQRLQEESYQKDLQESATEHLEHILRHDQFDL
ncbi:hypothetical protein [Anaerocellum danielii]|uniref:Uncharacterized protein n=1 Tax=Anaerocellum danielii TaxID=1387557 RepID=A0ABZ0TXM3_9FIRM|nr:hypothetical protein [Caldicellulosiruptor danielii]WPX08196.1 hypothetical protein SOJ16_002062 [Caldicellulosiruptor danielii]